MADFVTALAYRDMHVGHLGGSFEKRSAVAAHAVPWPDSAGRAWESLHTACGESTKDMEHVGQWPAPRYGHMACQACTAVVEQSA